MKNTNSLIETASGAVRLSGKVSGSKLKMYTQEHVFGNNRSFTTFAKYDGMKIKRSILSHDNDSNITLILQDDDASVKVILQDCRDSAFGYVTVSHDNDKPKVYKINIKEFLGTRALKSITGEYIDVVGKRKPPKITSKQIFKTFKKDNSYRSFMRGDKPEIEIALSKKKKKGGVNWKCAWICLIPGCGLTCLFWKPLKKKKKEKFVNSSIFASL